MSPATTLVHVEPTGRQVGRIVAGALARTAGVALAVFTAAFLTDQLGGSPSAWLVLGAVLPALWLAGELLLPRTTQHGEWSTLLDGQAAAADAVYAGTFRALQYDHAVPAEIQPRRVRVGPPVPGLRNVLRLRLGRYAVTVAVFPFGHDLHVGWTLIRREVPVVTVFRWLVAMVAVDTGYVDVIEVEPAKALGEAVQHAVLAGIAAAERGDVTLVGAFGAELAVEEADHRSSA